MRHARLLVALPAVFCLACPGDWDEPLGPVRGGHIDSDLVGDWRCEAKQNEDPNTISIVPFDKNQYVITVWPDKEGKLNQYRAYTTTVSGYDVMNVKELDADPGDGAWIYMRFHLPQAGHLQVDALRVEPLDGVPSDVDSRRQAIGDLFQEPALWENGFTCVPSKGEEKPADDAGQPPRVIFE